jgi:hypothetical protein
VGCMLIEPHSSHRLTSAEPHRRLGRAYSPFFERVDPLFQLVQRTGCGLEITIQCFQRLPLINNEDIGISFPVA